MGDSYADDKGNERLGTLNEQLDVGVFTANLGDVRLVCERVLWMQRLAILLSKQTAHVITKCMPLYVGIDPYLTFIDRNINHHLLSVTASRQ